MQKALYIMHLMKDYTAAHGVCSVPALLYIGLVTLQTFHNPVNRRECKRKESVSGVMSLLSVITVNNSSMQIFHSPF